MKIYAHTVGSDKHLQDNLRTKEIIDQFVGTAYWVKCRIDKLGIRESNGFYRYIDVDDQEPWWVQFNEINGSFYKIHYLYCGHIYYEGTRNYTNRWLTGYSELGFIHVVEPISVMSDDEMFDPDNLEDDE